MKSIDSLESESYFSSASWLISDSKDLVTHEKDNWYKQAKNNRIVKTQIALLFCIKKIL